MFSAISICLCQNKIIYPRQETREVIPSVEYIYICGVPHYIYDMHLLYPDL